MTSILALFILIAASQPVNKTAVNTGALIIWAKRGTDRAGRS